VKFDALTSMAGTPLSTPASQPASLPVIGGAVPDVLWIALGAGIMLVAAGLLLGRGVTRVRRS
jgi:hypothetical protein